MARTDTLQSDQQDGLTTDIPSFAMVPDWVLDRASGNAVKLYGIIKSYADNKSSTAFPGRKTLAQRMGYASVRSIDTLIKELQGIGALSVTQQWRGNGRQTSNLYMIRFNPPRMKPGGEGAEYCAPKGGQNIAPSGEQNIAPHELDPVNNSYPNEVEGVAVDIDTNTAETTAQNEAPTSSRSKDFRRGKWMPSDEALQTAREVNQFVDIPILISKYAVWCQEHKRQMTSSGWLQWFFKDEQRLAEEERKRRAEERKKDVWHRVDD